MNSNLNNNDLDLNNINIDLDNINLDDIDINLNNINKSILNLDENDKKLLADKLIYAYRQSKTSQVHKFFLQIKDAFKQFNIDINFSKNITKFNNLFVSSPVTNPDLSNINNVLLIQLDNIGDNILATPFIREFHKNFLNAYIDYICPDFCAPLFNNCPYINKVIPINIPKNLSFPEITNFCKDNLWNIQYDFAINLNWQHNSVASMLNLLSAAKIRLAYKSNIYTMYCSEVLNNSSLHQQAFLDQFFYTHTIKNPADIYHESERKLWILSYLDLPIASNKLELWINPSAYTKAKELLKNIPSNKQKIILGIGGSNDNQRYPYNKLVEAVKLINNENNYYIILGVDTKIFNTTLSNTVNTTGKEKEQAEYITQALNENNIPCLNLVGKATLDEAAAIINLSNLYFGNDTGLMHIASVFNKPILCISREAVDKNNHPGSISSLARFKPLYAKTEIVQPPFAVDHCIESFIYGGCYADYPHCISTIEPEDIAEAYNNLIN